MKSIRTGVAAAVVALALCPACRLVPFHRSAKAKVPPPQPAATQPAPGPEAEPATRRTEAVILPEPPQLPPEASAVPQPPPYSPGKLPPRPRGRHAARREAADEPASTAPAQPPETVAAPQPVPQLEQILTPEQQAAYNEEIDRNIGHAQRTVSQLDGKPLNAEQKMYLERIRAFIQQAADARKSDLFRAKNLAERASVLADDLFKSVQ